ncbi:hypothetical protein [Acidiphilium acidophilum]|uniref:hypothetical protein n=1 Tax=Acidiphilium acidophilum TaxID=76588 RepID=UPI002E8E6BF2|nr:hypothetical protein [Acidiphilium acidophilum]
MLAVHLLCGRDNQGNLRNLTFDDAAAEFRSGNWDISEKNAELLVGGWIYLHPTKSSPSELGGVILGFEPITDESLKRSNRIVFIVREQPEARGRQWRGKAHGPAHSSGLVGADFPHETGSEKLVKEGG